MAERPDAFMRGLLVIVAVALIVGLPALVSGVAAGFRPAAVEPNETQINLSGAFDLMRPWLRNSGLPDALIDAVDEAMQANAQLSRHSRRRNPAIADALAPARWRRLSSAIGAWLSLPFASSPLPLAIASLATWLGYGIFVMLFARLLGGRGTLHGFFGATGFFAAPHILNILAPVPVLGAILSVVAFVWGVVIYTIATAVSHRLTAGRARWSPYSGR